MPRSKHFPVVIEQDKDGVYIVSCPLFQGCHSYGYTVEEAMENIREAIQACMDEMPDISEASTKFIGLRDLELSL
ncbi:type II toxin-antitoxin system HicB family antitoxin [Desulfonatronum thioautotrophicum]|uniref:type II toxin-antitoxin system HicB family antitoxin n=1 Tax=Desulfonatronum thioautotrophicum TaxID=617001 RepID=UPI0005EB4AFF|nr:type II toxin-antitoxin system HicB family antitoxin [Desulfonatronum thioautotrophicum]